MVAFGTMETWVSNPTMPIIHQHLQHPLRFAPCLSLNQLGAWKSRSKGVQRGLVASSFRRLRGCKASPARASFRNQGGCSLDQSEGKLSLRTQMHQVLQNFKNNGQGAVSSWPRSMAIALLSYTMSLQLGVMEVQAHPQAENIESYMWDLNPHSTAHFDKKIDTYAGSPTLDNGNKIFQLAESGGICEETYGFLPCSTSVGGNLFLMLGYGYLLFLAAKFISDGSELLLEVMNPGLLGGLLLPILGAFPDSILILVSGVGGTPQQAQEEVMVGVGVLAGSSVMLLTIAWAGSLIAGRCDLTGPSGTATDLTLTRPFDPIGTGVTTDEQTRVGAWIMMVSTLPFLFAQLPLLPGHLEDGPTAALGGCIVASVGLLAYSAYQVASPWLQQKKIEEARLQFFRSRALQRVASFPMRSTSRTNRLFQDDKQGHLTDTVKNLFHTFDHNKDGKIQQEELRGLIVGIGLEEAGFVPAEEQVETWLKEFDLDVDGTISEHEFVTGIKKWTNRVAQDKAFYQAQQASAANIGDSAFWAQKSNEAKAVLELLESEAGVTGESEEDTEEAVELDPPQIYRKAALYMLAGAALAAAFADPMVDSIGNFSAASHIPPFFVAFVVTPFASNASELVSSIIFAKRRRKRNISLTFSQVYGAITMNNTLY
ncbi:hypothetical protein M758_11G060700 [Ceratodon purpureus]|nr:hypothetical protein M758_11G060700 [Ceratodon purpureus]